MLETWRYIQYISNLRVGCVAYIAYGLWQASSSVMGDQKVAYHTKHKCVYDQTFTRKQAELIYNKKSWCSLAAVLPSSKNMFKTK